MNPRQQYPYSIHYFGLVVAFAVITLASAYIQLPHAAVAWESVTYLETAKAFSLGHVPTGTMPSIGRIGVPFIVSLLNGDHFLSFLYLNTFANLTSSLLMFGWLKRRLSPKLSLFLVLALSLHWLSSTRFTFWAPVSPDPWSLVAIILGLLIIDWKPAWSQSLLLTFITLVGVFIRESVIVIPLAYAVKLAYSRKPNWLLQAILPLASASLGLLLVRALVHVTADIGIAQTMYHWAYEKTTPQVLLGFLMAFGVATVLIFNSRTKRDVYESPEHLAFVIVFAIAAWFGGTDTERIFLWCAPVMLLWIGYGIQDRKLINASLIICSALTARLFWVTPEYPGGSTDVFRLLTPLTGNVLYTELLSFHMKRGSSAVILLEYLAVATVLTVFYYRRTNSLPRRT